MTDPRGNVGLGLFHSTIASLPVPGPCRSRLADRIGFAAAARQPQGGSVLPQASQAPIGARSAPRATPIGARPPSAQRPWTPRALRTFGDARPAKRPLDATAGLTVVELAVARRPSGEATAVHAVAAELPATEGAGDAAAKAAQEWLAARAAQARLAAHTAAMKGDATYAQTCHASAMKGDAAYARAYAEWMVAIARHERNCEAEELRDMAEHDERTLQKQRAQEGLETWAMEAEDLRTQAKQREAAAAEVDALRADNATSRKRNAALLVEVLEAEEISRLRRATEDYAAGVTVEALREEVATTKATRVALEVDVAKRQAADEIIRGIRGVDEESEGFEEESSAADGPVDDQTELDSIVAVGARDDVAAEANRLIVEAAEKRDAEAEAADGFNGGCAAGPWDGTCATAASEVIETAGSGVRNRWGWQYSDNGESECVSIQPKPKQPWRPKGLSLVMTPRPPPILPARSKAPPTSTPAAVAFSAPDWTDPDADAQPDDKPDASATSFRRLEVEVDF